MADTYTIISTFSSTPPRQTPFPRWGEGIVGLVPSNHVLLQINGETVSQCDLHPTTAMVNDSLRVPIVGIGGVKTGGPWRRKGYGRLIVKSAVEIAKQRWQPNFLVLFSLKPLVEYYRSMGWEYAYPSGNFMQQPKGILHVPHHVEVLVSVPNALPLSIESFPW